MSHIMKLLKKLLKLIFNRIFYIVFALLVQLGWLFMMAWKLAVYSKYISIGITAISIIAVLWILNKKINPSYKLGWTMLILVFPVFGLLLYILFGKSRIAQKIQEHYAEVQKESLPYMEQDSEIYHQITEEDPSAAVQSNYIRQYSGFPAHGNTTAQYFQVGDDMFPVLVEELERAQHYIYIEYFIINDGVMWRTILDILEQKVAQGVDVRLIYDGFGCLTTLPYKYDKFLREKGIQCKVFNPFRPVLNIIQNNRDHRKICVIDGKTGFTGGINLADEYINQKERFGHWKDTAVLLRGDAVQSLTMIFLQMWDVDMRGVEPYGKYLTKKADTLNEKLGYVIPYADSPFDHENVGEEVYFHILNHAKKYVHIMTPYLILDNEMLTTLIRAAKSGIEVIIIMPHIPDKWYAFAVAKTYYKELIEGGVQIYEYTPGFVHAKIFVSDDDTATVGSINLDFRSLYLHFENGVFIYDNPEVQKVEEDFQNTLAKCHKVTVTEVRNRGILMKTAGQVLRLVAPLM